MENIIYSKLSGKNDPMFGKYEHPIKALIEEESSNWRKKKTSLTTLFNIERSYRYSETIIGQSSFSTFAAKKEGQGAQNDTVQKTFDKKIEHLSFGKEFSITREMVDDAKIGISADMRKVTKQFTRAYYRTQIEISCKALINATSKSMRYSGETVDLTTGDDMPLFSKAHKYALDSMAGKTQSNYFYAPADKIADGVETLLNAMANKVRNFKDENGENLGYIANVVIVPCNRPEFEAKVKKACGSERTVGTANNDINTQYGNWTVVVLDGWETDADEIMVMSSEANEELSGNMFFNRVNLDVRNRIDDSTRNFIWNGYCRFGVGFGTWKHIARCKIADTANDATALFA